MSVEQWLNKAKEQYDPNEIHRGYGVDAQTSFGSVLHLLVANGINTFIANSSQPANVLIVGPGGTTVDSGCMPYELFELTAYFESVGLDYSLDIVDINPYIIQAIIHLRQIVVSCWDVKVIASDHFQSDWKNYCTFINYPQDISQIQV